MRGIAALALIALATNGCIGSSGTASHITVEAPPVPKTGMTITYAAPTCPPGARCLTPFGKAIYLVKRHLTCSPAAGSYSDPAAACRALADIVTKQRQQQSGYGIVVVRQCAMVRDAPTAFGLYDGKRRAIRLDRCSLCNLKGVSGDLAVLLPGAEG